MLISKRFLFEHVIHHQTCVYCKKYEIGKQKACSNRQILQKGYKIFAEFADIAKNIIASWMSTFVLPMPMPMPMPMSMPMPMPMPMYDISCISLGANCMGIQLGELRIAPRRVQPVSAEGIVS